MTNVPHPTPRLQVLAPVCWGLGCALSYTQPGDEYALYAIGSIAGSWVALFANSGGPPLFSVLLTGCAVLFGLGWLLDRLGANRRLWAGLWVAIGLGLLAWSIGSFESYERAMRKNGSLLAYVAASSQLGITLASLVVVGVAAMRRVLGDSKVEG